MRALIAVCCPGAAEGLAPPIPLLLARGHHVDVIGVDDPQRTRLRFGGSAAILNQQRIPYVDARLELDVASLDDVPEAASEHLIRMRCPDVIVVGTCRDPQGRSKGVEESCLVAANALGIASVQFVDSWEVWYPRRYPGCVASRYLVPDHITQRILQVRGGIPEARIRVTGNPAWERMVTASQLDRAALRRRLGLGPPHRFLIYFGDVTADDPTTLYWVLRHRAPMDRVLFRRHPRDVRDYSQLMADYPEAFINVEWTSDVLLFCADVCLTHHGAMGMKAALAGIPTINFILAGDCDELCRLYGGFPLSLLGGSYQVCSERDYQQVIARVVPPNAQELKRKLALDGQASLRIVRAIQDVADGQRSTDDSCDQIASGAARSLTDQETTPNAH